MTIWLFNFAWFIEQYAMRWCMCMIFGIFHELDAPINCINFLLLRIFYFKLDFHELSTNIILTWPLHSNSPPLISSADNQLLVLCFFFHFVCAQAQQKLNHENCTKSKRLPYRNAMGRDFLQTGLLLMYVSKLFWTQMRIIKFLFQRSLQLCIMCMFLKKRKIKEVGIDFKEAKKCI